jgi:hypothetical protein
MLIVAMSIVTDLVNVKSLAWIHIFLELVYVFEYFVFIKFSSIKYFCA